LIQGHITAALAQTSAPLVVKSSLSRLIKDDEMLSVLADRWLSKVRYVAQDTNRRILIFGLQVRNLDPSGRIRDHDRLLIWESDQERHYMHRDIPSDVAMIIPSRWRAHQWTRRIQAQAASRKITVLPEMHPRDIRQLIAAAFMSAQELRDLVETRLDQHREFRQMSGTDRAVAPLAVAASLQRREPIPDPLPTAPEPETPMPTKTEPPKPRELIEWMFTYANFDAVATAEIARLKTIVPARLVTAPTSVQNGFYAARRQRAATIGSAGSGAPAGPKPERVGAIKAWLDANANWDAEPRKAELDRLYAIMPAEIKKSRHSLEAAYSAYRIRHMAARAAATPAPTPAPAPAPATHTSPEPIAAVAQPATAGDNKATLALDLADAALVKAEIAVTDARAAIARAKAGVKGEIGDRILEALAKTLQELGGTA
jgi:hypothetical protein